MKLFIMTVIALFVSAQAVAMPTEAVVKAKLDNGGGENLRSVQLGTQMIDKKVQLLKAKYDFSVSGGAVGAINLLDVDGKAAVLPSKAVITKVIFDVITAPTSGGSATIALGANTTTDLKAATAIASYTGLVAGIPVGTAGTAVKTTAARNIVATIGTAALTAGKIIAHIEYYVSE